MTRMRLIIRIVIKRAMPRLFFRILNIIFVLRFMGFASSSLIENTILNS